MRELFSSIFIVFILTLAVGAISSAQAQRLRPPDAIKCDRNNLTAYSGKITFYQQQKNQLIIGIDSDENVKKRFTLRFAEATGPKEFFLLNSNPFTDENWKDISIGKNKLKPNMRATIWICSDGGKIIDWQTPPE